MGKYYILDKNMKVIDFSNSYFDIIMRHENIPPIKTIGPYTTFFDEIGSSYYYIVDYHFCKLIDNNKFDNVIEKYNLKKKLNILTK